jgi:hypothetical protein
VGSIPTGCNFFWFEKKKIITRRFFLGALVGFDHINRNAPVLIRTPKLTRFEPAQYWGGGPPGNSVVLNPFSLFFQYYFFVQCDANKEEKKKSAYWRG